MPVRYRPPTAREREVAELAGAGYNDKEIAAKLGKNLNTAQAILGICHLKMAVFAGIGGLLVLIVLGFFLTGVDFESYKFWAPKYENARRNVFVQTDSFVEGKISYLTTLELRYSQAEAGSASKAVLRTAILTEASQIDNQKLPAITSTVKRASALIGFAAIALLSTACDDSVRPSADQTQQRQQEAAAQEANAQSGFPGITNFTEKKLVKMLYEMRDKKVATFSYIPAMDGRLYHLCDSVGYGLPYGVQYTNPEKHVYDGQYNVYNTPQAEPNGLFMPPTADGTWVMCAGTAGAIDPVYVG